MDRIVFSTDAFPKHERFSAFCEEIVRRFSGLDLRTEDQSRFRANLELRRAGAVDIATNNSVAVNSVRTPGFVRDGDDALIVMLLQGGRAYQTQCGDRHALEPGEAIICDYGYSGEFNLVADSRFLSIKIPRRKLTVLLPHLSRFAGAKLDRDPVALRLLSGYLAGSLNVDLSGSARAAQLHQDHIIDLVALALGTDGVRLQSTSKQFALPNQPDVSAGEASYIDQLYRQLIGPPPATSSGSRFRAAPNNDAAGSVRR